MVRQNPPEEPSSPKTGDLALGRRIADRRDELGLSRKDLASATGLSYPYIAQIETGYRSPSLKHQFSIARALGLSLDDLFGSPEDQIFAGSPAPAAAPPMRDGNSTRSARTTARRTTIDDVIEHAVTEIETLPVSVRLEALSRIQLQIMQGVTEEQARRRT